MALTGVANLVATQNAWGVAVQGGVKVNAPWIAPDDVLYLQATYQRGALGYVTGNTLSFPGRILGLFAQLRTKGWRGSRDERMDRNFQRMRLDASQQMRETTGRRYCGCL